MTFQVFGSGIVVNFVAELSAATFTLHVALGLADGLLAPVAGDDVVRGAIRRRDVERHRRELQRGAALQEQHLVVVRHAEQLAQILSRTAPRTR